MPPGTPAQRGRRRRWCRADARGAPLLGVGRHQQRAQARGRNATAHGQRERAIELRELGHGDSGVRSGGLQGAQARAGHDGGSGMLVAAGAAGDWAPLARECRAAAAGGLALLLLQVGAPHGRKLILLEGDGEDLER
jgi:hypothetical protein